MAKKLHIVNGDCTAEILRKTTLDGDILVWREMLCEGPICKEVGSDDFWMNRYDFFQKELGVSKLEYFDKSIKEIVQLEDISSYSEVVLWFEFDLFCQVNLMALCSYLLQNFRKDIGYKLVCTGWVKGKDRLQSLSDFKLNEFEALYDNSLNISKSNLEFAEQCWSIYAENNIEKLKEFNFNKQRSKFVYFQKAIDQHLLRFLDENGMNQINNKILEIINNEPLTEKDIVRNLLIWQADETVYGFGDLQYFQYLNKLKKYYEIVESKYFLNKLGKSIFNL